MNSRRARQSSEKLQTKDLKTDCQDDEVIFKANSCAPPNESLHSNSIPLYDEEVFSWPLKATFLTSTYNLSAEGPAKGHDDLLSG